MITAVIDAGQHYCQAVSDLWQWDYGQTLRIQGVKIPAAVEVQFSTTERIGETVTRIGVTKEGVTEVPIPDTLLEGGGTTQDYTIYAFVYIENGDSGKTEYRVSMKVRARPKPEAHATPEEGELFRQAIVAVAESADRAESARESAETASDQAEDAKNAAEEAADEAKTSKENAETAAKVAEAFKTETETARSEAVRAATESTDAKDSAEKSRAAAEKAKQDAEAAKAAADVDKEAAETARSEAETAKNDAVQAKEAAEKAKIGTAADRETTETASKVARISEMSAEESAKKAETAKEEIQESADQIQKNAIEIDSLKENKIEKPAETPTIGKILRVKSVNEDGTFICEWADSGGSNLDVRINGESIVQNGTAEIPLCTKTKEAGLISIDTYTSNGGLHRANNETGLIRIASATNNQIDERRNKFCPIVPETIDYAVKAAMCDGKGAMWTADEQKASLERQGIYDWELLFDSTLEEDVIQYVHQFQNPFKVKKLLFIVDSPITDLATEKSIYVFWNKTKKYDYPMSIAWKSGAKGKASRWYTFIDIIEDYSIAHSYGMLINSSSCYMNAADNIKPNSESYASQMIKEKLLSTICLQSIQQDGGSIDKGTHILLYGIKG